jgi:hypothetical protein
MAQILFNIAVLSGAESPPLLAPSLTETEERSEKSAGWPLSHSHSFFGPGSVVEDARDGGVAQWDWQGVVGLSVCLSRCLLGADSSGSVPKPGRKHAQVAAPGTESFAGVPPLEPPRLEMEGRTRRGTGAVLRWHSTHRREEKNRNGGSKDGRKTRPESPA